MLKFLGSKFTWFYTISIFLLFFYSFTQIDLGLAFSRFPFLFSIQRAFQSIGYFNRPLSTYLYVGLLILLFGGYIYILRLVQKNRLQRKTIWQIILLTGVILTFSYNAFSHDLFNYIFDAKIFTHYHQNPYQHKALDFPGDPMLGFMHWTHRVYPYGPIWLGLTIPLSYAGMGVFVLTFFLFKILATVSYFGIAYYLEKIVRKIAPGKELFSLVFFALNPLVIIESVVSAHIDIVMMFFVVMSTYFLIQKKYLVSLLLFGLSIGIKFATVFWLPVYLAVLTMHFMKIKIPWTQIFLTTILCMFLAIIVASQVSGNFQSWYLLLVLPFAAIIGYKSYIFIPGSILSLGALLSYVPYLFLGNWNKPVPDILLRIYFVTVVLVIASIVVVYLQQLKTQNAKVKIATKK